MVLEDLSNPNPNWYYHDIEAYHEFLGRHLFAIWDKLQENLAASQQESKQRYDNSKGIISGNIQPNQKVLMKNETPDNKLDSTWIGPFVVKSVNWPNVILTDQKGKVRKVHLNKGKSYSEPSWDPNVEDSDSE